MGNDILVSSDKFIDAMSRVGNSVSVVTSDGSSGKVGITVSAVVSVTANPPSILICINDQSESAEIIKNNGVFCVNFLNSSQKEVSDLFAGFTDISSDPFDHHNWKKLITDCPVLSDALATFDCNISSTFKEGTHSVFIGRVVSASRGEGSPLIYSQRSYAKPDWIM